MRKFVIVAALFLLLTPAAFAKAYVGASLGSADANASGVSGDDTSWKIMGGYLFTQHLGIEGSYRDLGSAEQTLLTTTVGWDASSMDVFGVGFLPVGEKIDLFAKAGFARLEVDAYVSDPLLGTISTSDTGNELALGAGVDFKIGEKFSFRAEYETFDMDVISAGAILRF